MTEINGGYCRFFCLCSLVYVKETPKRLIDFIYEKSKPIPPKRVKDVVTILEPEVSFKIRTEALKVKGEVRARYSQGKIGEIIAEVKNYKLSAKMKERLLEIEKSIPIRVKKVEKPDEYIMMFKLEVRPKFAGKNLIRIGTLEELLKDRRIKEVFGLMEDNWPKPFQMTTCATYEFGVGKFKPAGGLLLPTEIPLPFELGTRFGKSELDGISIRFKESAIGLEQVNISLENETTLEVALRASYELTLLKEMLKKAYELSREIAYLLVQKVK